MQRRSLLIGEFPTVIVTPCIASLRTRIIYLDLYLLCVTELDIHDVMALFTALLCRVDDAGGPVATVNVTTQLGFQTIRLSRAPTSSSASTPHSLLPSSNSDYDLLPPFVQHP